MTDKKERDAAEAVRKQVGRMRLHEAIRRGVGHLAASPAPSRERFMTPTINVNLEQCEHPLSCVSSEEPCPAAPVLIPCPIPRSATFEVRLPQRCPTHPHDSGTCEPLKGEPGRCVYGEHPMPPPIRVSCSISGKTWEESEVDDVEMPESIETDPSRGQDRVTLESACRERWALAKALMLGKPQEGPRGELIIAPMDLFAQRDAVYAAIARTAQAEDAVVTSANEAAGAMGSNARLGGRMFDTQSISAGLLARYVELLIEQVGVLP